MKVSLSWLREYLPVDMPVRELADRLTMAGLEVGAIWDRYAWLSSVRVGRIASVSPHPHADKLTVCDVDLGERTVRVVCGAPNVTAGMLAPLALPGTEFPDGKILTEGLIRGIISEGMLCSEAELELGPDPSGILTLDPAIPPGQPLSAALRLHDPVMEVELTPNRPDCLSVIGIAREIGAFTGRKVAYPTTDLPPGNGRIADYTSVTILAPDHCPRYAARLIEDVVIRPSPFWLQDRLASVGLRPINNIVDATNFVMMETGQPLHAFDFDHLAENRIVVRTAGEGESFTTLDGKERKLSADMLMICDGRQPVAVAGVMGGLNSEIKPNTTRVLIESAYFSPVSTRKTAKTLGLSTDASHRFERGVDPEGTLFAIDRAARLMLETAGGRLIHDVIDARPVIVKNRPVDLDVTAANRRLGTRLDAAAIARILESIEFAVEIKGTDHLTILPPSFRVDVTRPEDLMEEVARLWGYRHIPVTFPATPCSGVLTPFSVTLRNHIKDRLVSFGFSEAITYSFIGADSCDRIRLAADDPRRRMLGIINPIALDQNVMRTSLVPGLLDAMKRNLSWQNRNLKLFEAGKIFISNGQDRLPDETEMAALLWTGVRTEGAWHTRETACDFYDIKGIVEALLLELGVADLRFTAVPERECRYLRPGRAAHVSGGSTVVGNVGEVHPLVLKHCDLKQPAFMAELNLDALAPWVRLEKTARGIPKFPPVARDITLIVAREVEALDLLDCVRGMGHPLFEDMFLFDVYEGDPIPEGKKSVSFRIIYRSETETLEDEVVTRIHREISEKLLSGFNAAFSG